MIFLIFLFEQCHLNLFLCFCNALSEDGVTGEASVVRKDISSRLKIVMHSDNITGQELEFDYIGREKDFKNITWTKKFDTLLIRTVTFSLIV